MPKSRKPNKELKKRPLHTLKEKRTAKQLKKHADDVAPFIAKSA
jgi:hypothetical protein